MRRTLSFCCSLFLAGTTAVLAEDRPNTILVMDGSGSMWGQIDEVAKITIAQEVMEDLLNTLPEDQSLGLIAYGHRERGNCTDIELMIEPGPSRRDAIAASINEISPLGKTPMTDAVIAAAEALRYTEDSATVILVSDGVETCNPDPCAAARILEETGVDFTAHVIGFDVGGDAEATAQMQCIADETGGLFIPASDAGELAEALTAVVEPEIATVPITFRAVIGDEKTLLESPVLWDVNSDTSLLVEDVQDNPLTVEMSEGAYVATAYSLELEQTVNVSFVAIDGGTTTVEAIFEEPAVTASLIAPATVPGGSTFQVGWNGPDAAGDDIQIYPVGEDKRYDYQYVDRGNPLSFIAPFQPGAYELRYVHEDRETIGLAQFTVTETPVGLDAPAEVPVGETFDVTWVGPNAQGDNVQIGPVGENNYTNYSYTDRGNPVSIKAPSDEGTYELRYKFRDRETIYTQPIEVVAVLATVEAPAEAIAGSTITVEWTGPGYAQDYIGIGVVGADGSKAWQKFTYTRDGSPLDLVVPITAGDYEISYFLGDGSKVLATQPITVAPATATVTAPAEVIAGATIAVDWTGPDYQSDYIGIGKADADGSARWENFAYTRDGSPIDLLIPVETGDYTITYFAAQDSTPLASTKISVQDIVASVTAPETAIAGSTIAVDWVGPDYQNDYIGIGLVGADGANQWDNFSYTRDGTPLSLLTPTEPGDYIISYFVGQDRANLASTTIALTTAEASVTAPATVAAGSTIAVDWIGPDYQNDYIGIGLVGADGSKQWENFSYTRDGTPAELLIPTVPGDYVISYFSAQDRSILASAEISVETVAASVIAPGNVPAGATIAVDWTGPDYNRDYIGIGRADADGSSQWENFTYTSEGAPLELLIPTAPGDYVISYFSGQDRSILASTKVSVEKLAVTVTAPESATAGSTITVDWTGPDYNRDYIGIGRADADRSARWENYTYTTEGAPLSLLVPTTPGDYIISYFSGQDRSILASTKLSVEELAVTITAPASATAGSTITVDWAGPDYDRDYIGIGRADADRSAQWENFTYTSEGAPLELLIPTAPGDYVISYFSGQDRSILASVKLVVEDLAVYVSAPESVIAGADIPVAWDGPNYDRDYIGIGKVGSTGNRQWENRATTDTGNPVTVLAPITPGDYVIGYFAGQDRELLASTPITILDVTASVTAPATAVAGDTITVTWDGPAYDNDYIGIGLVGADGNRQWRNRTNVTDGSPLELLVPADPGEYLITYFAAQDRTGLKATPITVLPVENVQLLAADTAPAGGEIIVGWDGPNYNGDFIGIGLVGADGNRRWEERARPSAGNPLTIPVPETPGDYVITYFLGQDRTPVKSRPLTVE